MKNKQMYVITMATGSYDDYSLSVVSITDDLEKGQEYVNGKNKAFIEMEKKFTLFYSNEYKVWHNSNPRPQVLINKLPNMPSLADKKMTKEMKKERELISKKYQEETRVAHLPLMEWSEKLKNFVEGWFKENLTEEEFEIYKIRNENHWEIVEVGWLK